MIGPQSALRSISDMKGRQEGRSVKQLESISCSDKKSLAERGGGVGVEKSRVSRLGTGSEERRFMPSPSVRFTSENMESLMYSLPLINYHHTRS